MTAALVGVIGGLASCPIQAEDGFYELVWSKPMTHLDADGDLSRESSALASVREAGAHSCV